MTAPGELRALTSIRGVAAWAVVLYHIRLSIAGLPEGVVHALSFGYLAVDFFFLLSGFVIWMTWSDRLRRGGRAAVLPFLRKRVARIWPLHLVILGGCVLLALLLAATGRPDSMQFPLPELPLHLLLVQNWGLTDRLTWNPPAWSISTELFAYLVFPLFVALVDLRRLSTPGLLGLIVVLPLTLHTILWSFGADSLGDQVPRLGLIRCLLQFGCGCAVAALWERVRQSGRLPILLSASVMVVTGALTMTGYVPETLGVPLAFAALLLLLALTTGLPGHPLEGRTLHYLGEVSFATYLAHFPLWIVFKLAFVTDAYAVPPQLIALYLATVLASSIALYHLVERPAQRAINTPSPRRTPART